MNTMLRNPGTSNQNALAPSNLTAGAGMRPQAGGIHKGIWIGGGLMALTIIALATALVVKGNGSGAETAAPVAATTATPVAETTAAATAPATVVPVAQAPVTTPAPTPTTPHHHTTHTTPSTGSTGSTGGNTTVAQANTGTGGTTPSTTQSTYTPPPVCSTCGTIESVNPVKLQGKPNGVGAVGGGVLGAVVGSKIAGRNNHTLGGIIGAIGGGLAGNAIEEHERTYTAYDVTVRMEDGSERTIRQSTAPQVGAKVTVNGSTIQSRGSSSGGSSTGSGNTNYGNTNYGNSPTPSGNGSSSFSPSGN